MNDYRKELAETKEARTEPGDLDEKSPGQRRHKDKKRWCKGKVGVEHTPVCMPYKSQHPSTVMRGTQMNWREYVCTKCGKVLDTYFAFRGSKRKKPDWVTS